jgi:hypothetical protein
MDLIGAIGSMRDLESFIMGGHLSRALTNSSNSDMQAASFALRRIDRARDPNDDVRRAVDYLQAAHAQLHQAWTSLTAFGAKTFRMKAYANANRLDQWVSCALTACYLFVRERELVGQSIRMALEAEKNDPRYLTWTDVAIGAAGGLASSLLFESSFSSVDDSFVFRHQQCKEFCQKAEQLVRACNAGVGGGKGEA